MHVINDERPRYLLTIKSIAVVLLFVIFRRMFKIYQFFLHDFIGFLTSINYMDKWVTLLWVRLGLGEQPFLFGYDWRVIGGHNPT